MLRLVILRVLESYFRHRWLWLLPIVAMIGFAGLSVARTKPLYIARGAIYVQKQSLLASLTATRSEGFSWVTPAQATVSEMKELMQTDAFIRALIKQTALDSEMSDPATAEEAMAKVRSSVWIQTLGDNLVAVGAGSEEAELAYQLATATIETYVQWNINSKREESAAAQTFFTDLIKTYQADLDQTRAVLEQYYQEHPDPVRGERSSIEELQIDRLTAAVDLAASRLASALDKEENTRLSMAKSESEVRQKYFTIDAPLMPEESENSTRGAVMGSLIFVVVGIILTCVGVAGGALIDSTFRFPVDVRHGIGLPVLASLPDDPPAKKGKQKPAAKQQGQAEPKEGT